MWEWRNHCCGFSADGCPVIGVLEDDSTVEGENISCKIWEELSLEMQMYVLQWCIEHRFNQVSRFNEWNDPLLKQIEANSCQ